MATPAVHKGGVGAVELAPLKPFIGERLHHAHARQRVFDLRIDVADAFAAEIHRLIKPGHHPFEQRIIDTCTLVRTCICI
jgi:hypothetical protein